MKSIHRNRTADGRDGMCAVACLVAAAAPIVCAFGASGVALPCVLLLVALAVLVYETVMSVRAGECAVTQPGHDAVSRLCGMSLYVLLCAADCLLFALSVGDTGGIMLVSVPLAIVVCVLLASRAMRRHAAH